VKRLPDRLQIDERMTQTIPTHFATPPCEAAARGNWRDLWPAMILLVISVLGSIVAGSLPRPGDTRFAVIAPPWYGLAEAAELVGKAGGAVVDAGGLPNVIIAQSEDSGFVGALYRQGAWLVTHPLAPGGCRGAARDASPLVSARAHS
jgi:hypothetical protein